MPLYNFNRHHFSLKFFSFLASKSALKNLNKIKLSFLKDPILTEIQGCTYFIPNSSCILGYTAKPGNDWNAKLITIFVK